MTVGRTDARGNDGLVAAQAGGFIDGTGIDGRSLHFWIYQDLFVPWAGELNGSLAFAIATVLLWWLVLYGLYRRRWIIRL